MRLLVSVASLASVLVLGCRASNQPVQQPHPQAKALERTWRHSQEEDQGAVQVYRPDTYAFPPARGREGYTFAAGGQLTKSAIAPTDGSLAVPGRWRWENAHVLRLDLPGQSPQTYRLNVVELTADVLKVSPVEPR